MKRALVLTALCALAATSACKKEEAAPAPAASQAAAAPASAAPPPVQKPWYEGSWKGSYKAERHTIDLPVGAVQGWNKDDGSTAAGDGSLELTVDAEGVVSGSAKGPLGNHRVRGTADEEGLAIELVPEEKTAEAFRGVAQTTREGESLKGELKASSGDSRTLRKASLTLSKQPGG